MAIGHLSWAIPEGYIPGDSVSQDHDLMSDKSACILNPNDASAHVEITLYFEDREPVGPYRVEVGTSRATSPVQRSDDARAGAARHTLFVDVSRRCSRRHPAHASRLAQPQHRASEHARLPAVRQVWCSCWLVTDLFEAANGHRVLPMAMTVSDFFWKRIGAWGVKIVFGYPGDGINGLLGALQRADEKIEFIQVRHEEMAAFMAQRYAKFTGELGVCIATSGPGASHLLTGLYDARLDHMPVLAIAGQQARAALGGHYQQEIDLPRMFKDVAGAFVAARR